jgi:hypothetical protein
MAAACHGNPPERKIAVEHTLHRWRHPFRQYMRPAKWPATGCRRLSTA